MLLELDVLLLVAEVVEVVREEVVVELVKELEVDVVEAVVDVEVLRVGPAVFRWNPGDPTV